MPRAPKRFDADFDKHLATLDLSRPRWRVNIAADLLTSNDHGPADKVTALAIDEGGCGSRCRYTRSTIADRTRQTDRAVREATTRLSRADWLTREQRSSTSWTYRLLNRQPAAWLPGWTMPWYRSQLGREYPPECLLLAALAIQHTPSPAARARTPGLGPWCELPEHELARQLRCSRNSLRAICEGAALAGLILLIRRPGQRPIVYPLVNAVTRQQRSDLALCLVECVQNRDGLDESGMLHGPEGATVWDDDELAELLTRRLGSDRRVPA